MPSREPTTRWSALRRHPRAVLAVAVTAVALVAVTAMGGWAPTTADGPRAVEPGTEVTAAPFRFSFDSARAAYKLDGRLAEPGLVNVVVHGRIELAVDQAVDSPALDDAIDVDLEGGQDFYGESTADPTPMVTVVADRSTLLGLGPGLAYEVRFDFLVEEASVPDEITLTLNRQEYRPSALDGTLGWYDPVPVARVTLDVAPLVGDRPEEEY